MRSLAARFKGEKREEKSFFGQVSSIKRTAATICEQGCQIFLGTTYQSGENIYQKGHKIYQMIIKNCQSTIKYIK
jgi:hypothetical protein